MENVLSRGQTANILLKCFKRSNKGKEKIGREVEMGIDYFASDDDSSSKGEELCKKVCAEFSCDPGKCKTSDGSYKMSFKMRDGQDLSVFAKARLSSLQGISDKMVVWSYVAPLAAVPLDKKDAFLTRLLSINFEADTCAVGLDKKGFILVKAERMLGGLDVKELKDMIKSTFSVTQKLQLDVCTEFKVRPVTDEEIPD